MLQEGGAGGAGPAGDPLEAQLTEEQRAWLEQMVNTYGAQFQVMVSTVSYQKLH